jgi:hypothetical protein
MIKLIIWVLFLLDIPLPVWAASIYIADNPASISYNQYFGINLTFSCPKCGDSYFRGVFFQPGQDNYFGYTLNNQGNWINSVSDKTQFFKISETDIQIGTYSGKIQVKPDPDSPYFKGTGDYQFKLARYTSGGDSSAEWSVNNVNIQIIGPPTLTPSVTITPKPSITPTVIISQPTNTITVIKIPTNTSIPIRTVVENPTNGLDPIIPSAAIKIATNESVLGAHVLPSPTIGIKNAVQPFNYYRVLAITCALIGGGLGLLAFATMMIRLNQDTHEKKI